MNHKNRTTQSRKVQRDEDGRVIVNMTVKDDSCFLSVFSENLTPMIDSEVAEYIEASTCALAPHEQITLRIHSNCIDAQEQVLYRTAVQEYYRKRSIANDYERRHNNRIAVILTIAGILTLLLEILYGSHNAGFIGTQVIDIVAWVLLWEATDISLFRSKELRIKRKRYRAYMSMKIEYTALDET